MFGGVALGALSPRLYESRDPGCWGLPRPLCTAKLGKKN